MGDHSKWFGGAHALDGMVILLLSLGLAVAAWRSRPGGRGLAAFGSGPEPRRPRRKES
jgi:hypothetical protein